MNYLGTNTMVSIALIVGGIGGCKSDSSFKQKAEPSSSAIQSAESAGATMNPGAAFFLRLAREEMDQAKEFFAQGKQQQGSSLLQRAEADAELATALSDRDAEKIDAANDMARLRQLRQDNQLPVSDEKGSKP